MSGKAEQKSFTTPDETRSFDYGALDLLQIGGAEIGRLTLQPGWRWSDHVKPLAGTELCEAPHFQYHVAGTLHVVMADGAEFDARPGDATAAADVTDTPALQRAVAEIAAALGGLDHLVANAGGTVGRGNLTSAGDDDFTATFALNAGHAAELIRAGLPHQRAAGGGAVVIISSVTGMRPAPRTAYAAAKAAEIHLAATAAQELAPARIRVNAVSPGSIMFPGGGWESFQRANPEDFAAFLAGQFPFGRLG